MIKTKWILSVLASCIFFTAIAQVKENSESNYDKQHSYGGWFCPDNFGGFPPVNINNLDQIPVVQDRLPTKEETQNGTSLMYFDTTELKDVRPLDIDLPRLATIFSRHNGLTELVIVIQAAVIGNDTVAGFRYPNGGNGTSWYGQLTFLSDQEVKAKGSQPIVYFDTEINATKKEIWEAIKKTTYVKDLVSRFDEKEFFQAEWSDNSKIHLDYKNGDDFATGIITTFWGNLYLHIDYLLDGVHTSEKLLVMEDSNTQTSKFHFVSGPHPDNIELKRAEWESWLKEVRTLSESN